MCYLLQEIDNDKIDKYLKTEGNKFTPKWFDDVMEPQMENKWEKAQIIGLGSVLITTCWRFDRCNLEDLIDISCNLFWKT